MARASKRVTIREVAESGDDYDATIKTPVDIVTVVKKVCAKTGAEYKIFEVLKEVTWHAR